MVQIRNRDELEKWLEGQPREVSSAIAARSALRGLPFLDLFSRYTDQQISEYVLPTCRSLAVSYYNAVAVDAAPVPASGDFDLNVAPYDFRADTASAPSAAIYAIMVANSDPMFFASVEADAEALSPQFGVSELMSSPLWLASRAEADNAGESLQAVLLEHWQRIKRRLLAMDDDWDYWTDWYDARLRGEPIPDALNRDLNLIPDDEKLWEQGPAVVNRRLKEIRDDYWRENAPPLGDIEGEQQESVTGFAVVDGAVDVITTVRDIDTSAQLYFDRVRQLAAALEERFAHTDAETNLQKAVAALRGVLGTDVNTVHPDQLRMAARAIEAKARAFSHPSATGEITPDSIALLFELSATLSDLQTFFITDVQANEAAIRNLGLTPQQVENATAASDVINEAIQMMSTVVSPEAQGVFAAGQNAADAGGDQDTRTMVAGQRTLLLNNLAVALARHVGPSGPDRPNEPPPDGEPDPQVDEQTARRWKNFVDGTLDEFFKKAPEPLSNAMVKCGVELLKNPRLTLASLAGLLAAINSMGWFGQGLSAVAIAGLYWYLFHKNRQSSGGDTGSNRK